MPGFYFKHRGLFLFVDAFNFNSRFKESPILKKIGPKTAFQPYLEGLRGCAALYVMLYHTRAFLDAPRFGVFGPVGSTLPFRGQFLMYGYFAVGVFIVISGFVLTIPIAISGDLKGGTLGFFRRRARRLLPAYFVALTLSVPLYIVALHQRDQAVSYLSIAGQYLAHALMLQDLNYRLAIAIDGPLWSIAVEVQIYIIFAILLLPVLKRFGPLVFLASAFTLGLLPTIIGAVRHQQPYFLQTASFWYLGLFALGSMAAFISYDEKYFQIREHFPWKLVTVISALIALTLAIPQYGALQPPSPWADIAIGTMMATGMIAVSKDVFSGRGSIVSRVFSQKPIFFLGTFSYSLYLIHDPIIWVATQTIQGTPPFEMLVLTFGVFVPLIIAFSYFFARAFEFPYMSRRTNQIIIEASNVSTSESSVRAIV